MGLPKLPPLPEIGAKFGKGLKALPTIAFALMLGCAFVITAFVIWYTFILGYMKWPDSDTVAEARINALAVALWIFCAGILLTFITLAFGKIERLTLSGSVVSGEIEFDDGEDDGPRRVRASDMPGYVPPGPHGGFQGGPPGPHGFPGRGGPPADDFVPPGPHHD